ncbi:MAG TPA: ATP-binding protein [Allosphingosinicella sp.]
MASATGADLIKNVTIKNLTVFDNARIRPSRGLNVIVGENGTGKTHLLKLLYCIVYTLGRDRKPGAAQPTKASLQVALAEKLVNVFRPDTLGRIARRRQGRERCDIKVTFDQKTSNVAFGFATNSKSEVQLTRVPEEWLRGSSVYLPTRELLSIFPNFVSIYEGHYLELEETWRDLAILLGAPLSRGPKEALIHELLQPLERAMEGWIVLDRSGRFYLQNASGKMEMPLVAEGLRKLGMVARLVATGALIGKGYLFWDEPESNLNPRLVAQVARTILDLSNSGIQVFIATHSLFLLREIELIRLASGPECDLQFFGLTKCEGSVEIEQSDDVGDLRCIAALEEELSQSDRFLEAQND